MLGRSVGTASTTAPCVPVQGLRSSNRSAHVQPPCSSSAPAVAFAAPHVAFACPRVVNGSRRGAVRARASSGSPWAPKDAKLVLENGMVGLRRGGACAATWIGGSKQQHGIPPTACLG